MFGNDARRKYSQPGVKEYLTTQPSGLAISTALFVIVVCFPLALLSGMNVDQAVLANVVLLVIVVPLAWPGRKAVPSVAYCRLAGGRLQSERKRRSFATGSFSMRSLQCVESLL